MLNLDSWDIPAHPLGIPHDTRFLIVCFGGGVDSTAMMPLLEKHNVIPDLITFADLHAEKPETYAHVREMDNWLIAHGFPPVTWCSKIPTDAVSYKDLEGNCIDNETLPSLAFGLKSCSIKWKQGPQDFVVKGCRSGPNECKPHPLWLDAKKSGVKPVKLIGYDAGPADLRRSKKLKFEDDDFRYVYPLQHLGWNRKDCIQAIIEAGIEVPLKSSCFFCPASKVWELYWLAGAHPDLFLRALHMERIALTGRHSRYDEIEFGASWESMVRNAESFPSSNTTVGLGRSFAWNQWAVVNNIIDKDGRWIGNRSELLKEADRLLAERTGDNALDARRCA